MEDHPLSAVHDCILSIFAVIHPRPEVAPCHGDRGRHNTEKPCTVPIICYRYVVDIRHCYTDGRKAAWGLWLACRGHVLFVSGYRGHPQKIVSRTRRTAETQRSELTHGDALTCVLLTVQHKSTSCRIRWACHVACMGQINRKI
jgi:hypothetical protein